MRIPTKDLIGITVCTITAVPAAADTISMPMAIKLTAPNLNWSAVCWKTRSTPARAAENIISTAMATKPISPEKKANAAAVIRPAVQVPNTPAVILTKAQAPSVQAAVLTKVQVPNAPAVILTKAQLPSVQAAAPTKNQVPPIRTFTLSTAPLPNVQAAAPSRNQVSNAPAVTLTRNQKNVPADAERNPH